MARTSELLCVETRPLLARLAEGELEGDERARVERHLDNCPACASEMRTAERALSALRGLPAEDRARLRDEALRELGVADEPAASSRGARLARLVLVIVAFALLVLFLRARRDWPVAAPRGVETR